MIPYLLIRNKKKQRQKRKHRIKNTVCTAHLTPAILFYTQSISVTFYISLILNKFVEQQAGGRDKLCYSKIKMIITRDGRHNIN